MELDDSTVEEAVERLNDDDPLREYADSSYSVSEDEVEELYEALDNDDRRRAAAFLFVLHFDQIEMMAKFSGEEDFVRAEKFATLLDSDPNCRAAGCIGLGHCAQFDRESVATDASSGAPEYAADVFDCLEDDDQRVRNAAAFAARDLHHWHDVAEHDGALANLATAESATTRTYIAEIVSEVAGTEEEFPLPQTASNLPDMIMSAEDAEGNKSDLVSTRSRARSALTDVVLEHGTASIDAEPQAIAHALRETLDDDERDLFDAGVAVGRHL